jgi:hypothetical protein
MDTLQNMPVMEQEDDAEVGKDECQYEHDACVATTTQHLVQILDQQMRQQTLQ